MLEMRYSGTEQVYHVAFRIVSNHVVELKGDFPVLDAGFTLSRIGNPAAFCGDYTGYTTVYRGIDGGAQFSDDGSVYVPPAPTPDPEPYVPTLEELIEEKVSEMDAAQQTAIAAGVNVTLSDGTVEHFMLTDNDQKKLAVLESRVAAGERMIPWHTSDEAEHCKFYSNADMALITTVAFNYAAWHETYFRDLRIYIRSLDSKEAVDAVFYGMEIPGQFQSEPLKAMIAAQEA